MSAWLQAADWSRFQPAHSEPALRRLQDAGVELVIPGAWHGDAWGENANCRGDLIRARNVGLRTATYVVLDSPGGTDAAGAVRRAYDIVGPQQWRQLSFVSLDIEVAGVTVPEIQRAVDEVRRLNQRPVIYTAWWFWFEVFGNPRPAWLQQVPLWNAFYDSDDDIDFASAPYGPWTVADVVGEQYTGTTTFAGVEQDRNSFSRAFIEEDTMGTASPVDGRLIEDAKGLWLVLTVAGHPFARKPVPDAKAQAQLKRDLGEPTKVGVDGEWSQEIFDGIRIVGSSVGGSHTHEATVRLS